MPSGGSAESTNKLINEVRRTVTAIQAELRYFFLRKLKTDSEPRQH